MWMCVDLWLVDCRVMLTCAGTGLSLTGTVVVDVSASGVVICCLGKCGITLARLNLGTWARDWAPRGAPHAEHTGRIQAWTWALSAECNNNNEIFCTLPSSVRPLSFKQLLQPACALVTQQKTTLHFDATVSDMKKLRFSDLW